MVNILRHSYPLWYSSPTSLQRAWILVRHTLVSALFLFLVLLVIIVEVMTVVVLFIVLVYAFVELNNT